jgi:hypothetical protein
LGTPEAAEKNRQVMGQAQAVLERLMNQAILSKRRGAVAVRVTFKEGVLSSVREVMELDS